MKKIFLFLILICSTVLAEGPLFIHKDQFSQQEYDNIYQDVRSVKNKVSNLFLNVKDYGAKGDGISDDTFAIQSAFNAALPGTTILIPGATYFFSSPLKLSNYDNVTISGYGAILKLKNSSNCDLMTSYNYPSSGGGQRPRILGLTIDGNSSNNTGSGSVVFYGIHGGIAQDMVVQNGQGVGYFFIGCSTWIVSNCSAFGMVASGFCAYNGCHNIHFLNCNGIKNAPNFLLEGLEVNGQLKSTGLRINGGNAIDAALGQANIQVFDGVEDFSIIGMRIRGSSGRGIDVYSGATGALTGANILPNKNGVISNNNISNNSSSEGIKIWDGGSGGIGANNILITGNRVYDDQTVPTQTYGIVLQSSANYITVSGNDVKGNGDPNNNILVGAGVNINGIVFNNAGDTNATSQTKFITSMVDSSSTTVANSDTPIAFVTIINDLGYMAGVALRGGFNATAIGFDGSAQFSTTAGTANKTNVFYNASIGKYQIENKTGGTRNYSIFYYKQ